MAHELLEALHYASDVDGCRHVVAPRGVHLAGWSVRVSRAEGEDRAESVNSFTEACVWWGSGSPNFLGFGEPGDAWVAVVDWHQRLDALVSPSQR